MFIYGALRCYGAGSMKGTDSELGRVTKIVVVVSYLVNYLILRVNIL